MQFVTHIKRYSIILSFTGDEGPLRGLDTLEYQMDASPMAHIAAHRANARTTIGMAPERKKRKTLAVVQPSNAIPVSEYTLDWHVHQKHIPLSIRHFPI